MNEEELYKNLLEYIREEVYAIDYETLEDGTYNLYMYEHQVEGKFTTHRQMLEVITQKYIQQQEDSKRTQEELYGKI